MDYNKLAEEFFQKMQLTQKARQQKQINETIHGEAFVLHCIKEKTGEIVPGDISAAMGVSSARVAAALNSLESKGYITREICGSDRRKIIIKLTQAGNIEAEEQMQRFLAMTAKMLAMLGEQDAREYVRISGRVAEIFATAEDPLCKSPQQ